jgi:hypothetical protein
MGGVRRLFVYLFAWAVAATVIVTVSWLGIRSALGAAVPARVSPLSAADLRNAVPSPSPSSPSPSPSSPSPPPSSPSPPPPSSAPPASPKPTTPATESWIPQSDGRGGTGYKRTFHTAGGDAVVWSARGDARVLENTPKNGWSASVHQDSQDSATVYFVVPGQRGRTAYVSVGWLNGGPIAEFGEGVGLAN